MQYLDTEVGSGQARFQGWGATTPRQPGQPVDEGHPRRPIALQAPREAPEKADDSMTASKDRRQRPRDAGGRLSIGALSRATGIAIDTLRTWERRYGFPVPQRKPSGHRVYPLESVVRLRRIAEALAMGHRAAEAVPASDQELDALLAAMPGRSAQRPEAQRAPADERVAQELIDAIRTFDDERLGRILLTEWARLGPLEFLRQRVAPLIDRVGAAWQAGELDIRHEHHASEKLNDLLRTLRLPFEERARGPVVVLATLPGELHALGLQMAALALSTAGCRVVNAGADLPVEEIAALAKELGARAIGISVSRLHRGGRAGADLERLRQAVPRRTLLLVGGAGAPAIEGVERIMDLEELEAWGRDLARSS